MFRSQIGVRSQNQDLPTVNTIPYDISQNRQTVMLAFSSMLKTSKLTSLFLLISILKNDIHTGKCGQGVLQRVINDIEAIATLCISMINSLNEQGVCTYFIEN